MLCRLLSSRQDGELSQQDNRRERRPDTRPDWFHMPPHRAVGSVARTLSSGPRLVGRQATDATTASALLPLRRRRTANPCFSLKVDRTEVRAWIAMWQSVQAWYFCVWL